MASIVLSYYDSEKKLCMRDTGKSESKSGNRMFVV